ncbi:MAG: hypothetical protein PWQ34_580 [Caldanaerobacter sp.]|uniref:YesL family protein n=1 Tax=Caldanaerobacter sp. TaxID=2930036 RepID=UPI0024AADCB7|nr:YesL family protein [Caldanaerobacter sp.]MDI3518433.1 hypothetical protein [Caldanaerobacter sp.]
MRDSKFWDFAYFVTDLIILNVLWLLASLPVITVFHSTDALFYSIRLLRKDEGGSVFREFWKGFVKHFWWMTANFFITALTLFILYVDIQFFTHQRSSFGYILSGLLLSMGLMFLITLIYTFLTVQYYEGNLLGLWKTSFVLGLGHLPQTILIIGIIALAFFVLQVVPITFFLILISGTAYLIDIVFEGIVKKYIKKD